MKQVSLEEIREKAIPILKQADIKKAVLFGSYVRGDYTQESDIDILIAFPENTTLIDVAHLKHELEKELEKKVDIVSYNAISPLLRDSILKHQFSVL